MNDGHADETVLVTGGTGYLAGWVISGLLQRGYRVRTTVRGLDKAEQVRAAVGEQAGGRAAGAVEFAAVDLLRDDGWDEAVAGADYVLHTASPMPFGSGVDLITTARKGTRRVLGAAARAGVKRAVLTSSGVTADTGDPDTAATESAWTAPSGTSLRAYPDSKILAERDAWDLAAATGLELTAVLPTFMQGPMLGASTRPGTVEIIRRLLAREIPAVPNIGWNIVDVRDIAELHILTMTSPAAAGRRFLGSGSFWWYQDIARILREKLPDEAAKVPTRTMPDIIIKLLAHLNPQMAMVRPELGRTRLVDSSKARTQLGWHPRPTEQTIIDTATALIANNALSR
ncbi:NAD-dependent epimerase/dehydratase family protein [Streptomyces sp. SID8382]|uniref:NAD-dependent epimerase/dehydratase family protein n=1 Tax=Streptomyces malaysiensis TaxID=92644 RepID=UPI000C2BF0B2|nr:MULTISPECIES: NAD-dependent epimerase/dehydratase family protein [unclassified Streptomyces]AUA17259.1 3 beta-hydroxysteroid dehydrogenase/Delta 5-->4-isomerase [Streptomyces sp. M56]MYX59092.1 NAD-dependent epimerase/dehydratase family protein [Streptomyces sp. SID8382]